MKEIERDIDIDYREKLMVGQRSEIYPKNSMK